MNKISSNHPYPKRRTYLVVALVIVLVVFASLELLNVTHVFHHSSTPSPSGKTPTMGGASTNSQKGEPQTGSSSTGDGSTSQPGDTKSGAGGSTTTTLLTPTGDFVSNHHPNLSGSPAPNTLSSVCTTTPGASCTITFTQNGVVKSLPAQTTDRGGSTYWNGWSLQSIGITAGTWKIQATSRLNSQTSSASDALDFVVAP